MSAELKALRTLRAQIRRTNVDRLRQEIPELEREIAELSLTYHALVRRHPYAWSRAERFAQEEAWKSDIVSFLQTHNTDPELWKKLES
jgi:hypothetical protein